MIENKRRKMVENKRREMIENKRKNNNNNNHNHNHNDYISLLSDNESSAHSLSPPPFHLKRN